VWCTKYRKLILTFKKDITTILQDICQQYRWTIKALVIILDHIHLFITAPPFDAPSKIAKLLKEITVLHFFLFYPSLHKELWKGYLWSPSYYCGTAGTVSSASVKKYIASQKIK
jgi:putative transposase